VLSHLPYLAYACSTEPAKMSSCANDLVKYYQVCFPEAAKTYESVNLFLPIDEGEGMQSKSPPGRADSPDSVLAAPRHFGY